MIASERETIALERYEAALELDRRVRNRIREWWRWREAGELGAVKRRTIHARDGGTCVWCGSSEHLQVDHVFPVLYWRSNDPANLQTLCRACNLWKGRYEVELVRLDDGRLYAERVAP
jgi:5-methylcytosine-specific restriction endonuclease McrA